MLYALNNALSLEKQEGVSRTIVIATDGYVTVEKRVFDLINEKLGEANFFAFGIGTAPNRYIIEGIARAGRGEPFIATNAGEATEAAERFMEYIEHPLLTDIKVNFNGFDAYDVEPPGLPDLFAQRPLILFGKYVNASGTVRIDGNTASGDYRKDIAVTPLSEDTGNVALKYLWARERIARLSDYDRVDMDTKEEIIDLGLKYNLMTEYTSFVAVDAIVRETGEVVAVEQPIPLPQGVSDLALGVLTCVEPADEVELKDEVEPENKKVVTWGKVKRTVLYQNYPNPFNPETWIPFQLGESADVVISIYDVYGQLVRRIRLGRLSAGAYVSKDRSAYWDGRNDAGEKVSSGVYFYTLQTHTYSTTRKMIIAL